MKHAIGTVSVKQSQAHLWFDDKWRRRWVFTLLLRRIGVKDRLPADAARGRRGQIEQQGPGSSGRDWGRARNRDIIEVIVCTRLAIQLQSRILLV